MVSKAELLERKGREKDNKINCEDFENFAPSPLIFTETSSTKAECLNLKNNDFIAVINYFYLQQHVSSAKTLTKHLVNGL